MKLMKLFCISCLAFQKIDPRVWHLPNFCRHAKKHIRYEAEIYRKLLTVLELEANRLPLQRHVLLLSSSDFILYPLYFILYFSYERFCEVHCRGDEFPEKRMRMQRTRLVFRVKLAADKPRVFFKLYYLHQLAVGRQPA